MDFKKQIAAAQSAEEKLRVAAKQQEDELRQNQLADCATAAKLFESVIKPCINEFVVQVNDMKMSASQAPDRTHIVSGPPIPNPRISFVATVLAPNKSTWTLAFAWSYHMLGVISWEETQGNVKSRVSSNPMSFGQVTVDRMNELLGSFLDRVLSAK